MASLAGVLEYLAAIDLEARAKLEVGPVDVFLKQCLSLE